MWNGLVPSVVRCTMAGREAKHMTAALICVSGWCAGLRIVVWLWIPCGVGVAVP